MQNNDKGLSHAREHARKWKRLSGPAYYAQWEFGSMLPGIWLFQDKLKFSIFM